MSRRRKLPGRRDPRWFSDWRRDPRWRLFRVLEGAYTEPPELPTPGAELSGDGFWAHERRVVGEREVEVASWVRTEGASGLRPGAALS